MSSSRHSRSSKGSYSSEKSSVSRRNEDAGHVEWKEGTILLDRYRIEGLLGDGTFGRVFCVYDMQESSYKALKVIRAVERYVQAAKVEADILRQVNRADPENQSNIVRLYHDFEYENNYCLIFEKLGMSLFDVIKKNDYRGKIHAGFRMKDVQSFARQMLKALEFMHTLRLTHTDLKPENILLIEDTLECDNERVIN